MQPGKILVAEQQGAFVIKLVGDVRLTYCTTLDQFLEHMFASRDFASVLIDLTQAESVDSTTLGQLAKLAITARQRYGLVPVILSTNPDITRVLDSMGFDRVYDIRGERPSTEEQLGELPIVPGTEAKVREKVLEAHRVLMGMSEHNRAEFCELVSALESDRR